MRIRPLTKVTSEGRVCTNCYKFKMWSEFRIRNDSKTGYTSKCKICMQKVSRLQNRQTYVERQYGLSSFKQLKLPTHCEICQLSCVICIDHNHETGNIRGGLCRDCNLLISFSKDYPELLRKAAFYLEKHHDR